MSALPLPAVAGPVGGQQDGKRRRKTRGRKDSRDLSSLDLAIMWCLVLHGPAPSVRELASWALADVPTMTLRVRRLERFGLVVVERGGRGLPNVIKPPKIGNPI